MKFVRGEYLNTELRKENDRLRAALAKAEAERDELKKANGGAVCWTCNAKICTHVHAHLVRSQSRAGHERARADKAEAEFSTRLETIKKDRREWMDRCDKAEAERDEAIQKYRREVERVNRYLDDSKIIEKHLAEARAALQVANTCPSCGVAHRIKRCASCWEMERR